RFNFRGLLKKFEYLCERRSPLRCDEGRPQSRPRSSRDDALESHLREARGMIVSKRKPTRQRRGI
ncbi:MAG: hypothetical protein ABIS29_15220, partial [Vicinamibacterales bacterium]